MLVTGRAWPQPRSPASTGELCGHSLMDVHGCWLLPGCCCQPPPPAEAELEEEEVLAGGWPAQAAAGIETVLVVSRELNSALCFSSRSTAVVMSSSATQLRLLSSHPSIQS